MAARRTLAFVLALVPACEGRAPRASRAEDAGAAGSRSDCPASALLCPVLRVLGDQPEAELGFRFGSPRDSDGDGWFDLAAGARFTVAGGVQTGMARLWSGATSEPSFDWTGSDPDALFGHAVLLVPDLDGDGLADVIASAPQSRDRESFRGAVQARSPASGRVLWRTGGQPEENFGWHLELTDDRTGDGVPELLVGAPRGVNGGRVAVLDTRRGTVLASYHGGADLADFGWYVASIDDQDRDGLADVLVGAPGASPAALSEAGSALLIASGSGRPLLRFEGDRAGALLGEVVAAIDDLDGDGLQDIALSATHVRAQEGPLAGAVRLYSSIDGAPLDELIGRADGELYGRFVGRVADLDGDGHAELAIGAPWAEAEHGARQGRFEVRSGHDLALLFEDAGATADAWSGWHIAAAPGRGPERGPPGLIVSSLRQPSPAGPGAGALDWYVARSSEP